MDIRSGEVIPSFSFCPSSKKEEGDRDWAMVLGYFQSKGALLTWVVEGQGPTTPAVGAGGGRLDFLHCPISSL